MRKYIKSNKRECDVLFIGEAEGEEEVKQKLGFEDSTGQFVNKMIAKALPGKSVAFDNACACNLEKGKGKPTRQDIHACRLGMELLIQELKPKVIMLFGEWAMKLAGITAKPVSSNGRITKYCGIPAVCSVHPAFVLRNPEYLLLLERSFSILHSFLLPDKDNICQIKTVKEFKAILDIPHERIALDIETTGLDPRTAGLQNTAAFLRYVRYSPCSFFATQSSICYWNDLFLSCVLFFCRIRIIYAKVIL